MISANELTTAMLTAANPEKAAGMQRFFKTGKGQYGEGDRFLGIPNPEMHRFAKQYRDMPLQQAVELLESPWHEIRSAALQIMVAQYDQGSEPLREEIFNRYLQSTHRVNNWDLVDLSAPLIVGAHLLNRDRAILHTLAASPLLWEQRIAIIATLTFIRNHDFTDTLKLAESLFTHKHDLMHKATGWMLREVGKRHRSTLTAFLNEHKSIMPRTALRYAIEHYPESERQAFMKRD